MANEKEITQTTKQMTVQPANEKFTLNYVMGQIEKIVEQTEHLHDSIRALGELPADKDPYYLGNQAKAQALADIVKCRETTNQQMLRMYEKMYEDLRPKAKRESEKVALLKTVIKTLGDGMPPIECKEALREILGVSLQDL